MKKNKTLAGVVIGIITSSLGGIIRYILVFDKNPDLRFEHFGIVLPYFICFLMPIIGGLAGWAGAMIANRISEAKVNVYLGGFFGGVVTALIFIPYPIGQ